MTPEFGIYIHWPFCQSKCPYCDFNSHVADHIDAAQWRIAYLAELNHYASETSQSTVTSIFFGGGTPSLMDPVLMADIISEIKTLWLVSPNLEITAEANPSSAEMAVFKGFCDAGVNRLSLGVQSFNDQTLTFLGRLHGAEEAKKAVEAAARVFNRVSFDLIYAQPGQTPENWRKELAESLRFASDYNVDHLSLYQLTIEPGTDFHRARVVAADEDTGSQLFEITRELTADRGYPAYEISNHAKPGQECRHNLCYWRSEDYIGIGPGAHGRLSKHFVTETTQAYRSPDLWLDHVEKLGNGCQKRHVLAFEERFEEIILMGLRLSEGVSGQRYHRLTGRKLSENLNPDSLQMLEKEGFLEFNSDILIATPDGLQRLNAVLAHLLT